MDAKSLRNSNLGSCNLTDKLLRDKCRNIFCIRHSRNYEVWIMVLFIICNGCKDFFKLSLVVASNLIGFCWSDISAANEGICIQGTGCALCIDELVHKWLREAWLIAFVVAATSVADHIDDDIFIKFLTVFKGKACNANTCLWIIAVDVEDRSFNQLGNIC